MFEQPWLGLFVLVGGLAFFAGVIAICMFVSPWLYFVGAGLWVIHAALEDCRCSCDD